MGIMDRDAHIDCRYQSMQQFAICAWRDLSTDVSPNLEAPTFWQREHAKLEPSAVSPLILDGPALVQVPKHAIFRRLDHLLRRRRWML